MPSGLNAQVPPSVVVLGAFALNDAVSFPWFAPAGFTRGALQTTGVLVFGRSASLEGPGTVKGRVVMNGTLRFASRGRLFVRGAYDQTVDGRMEIALGPNGRDLLEVAGEVSVAGILKLSGVPKTMRIPYAFIRGTGGVDGAFLLIRGLTPKTVVHYGPNEVVVAPK